jgi:hypothetical protein
MSYLLSRRNRMVVAVLAVFLILMVTVAPVQANVRTVAPGEVPAYARFGFYAPFDGTTWLSIVFYRPPDCIPGDFNLLLVNDPDAFACGPPTTEIFAIWENGPETDVVPIKAHLQGLGNVPVWFVDYGAWLEEIVDGELTIGELEAMPSLMKGTADYFMEELHPTDGPVRNGVIKQVARGLLDDGRSFLMTGVKPYPITGNGEPFGTATIQFN